MNNYNEEKFLFSRSREISVHNIIQTPISEENTFESIKKALFEDYKRKVEELKIEELQD